MSSNATNRRTRSRAEASTSIPRSEVSRSRWNSPARRRGTGVTRGPPAPAGSPPPRAAPASQRRSSPRAKKFSTNTSSRTAPRASSRTPAAIGSGSIPSGPHDPREERHRRRVPRPEQEPRRHPEEDQHEDEEHERDPLGPARVLDGVEVRRRGPPEDLLGDP